ncbi:MAG TPA: DNA polymerase III subunit delta' [Rhodanobacteraceae bacterium]|nr:DNA polymerase III subunit delta' [Rhodanobacteraceae bacterium]
MSAAPPWHDEAWQQLRQRLDGGRFPHALLIVGEAGLGKRQLAERLATRLLCREPLNGDACGRCRACQLLAAGSHPDRVRVSFEANREGKLRSEIVIEQIRQLNARLAMTSQLDGWQVASIDPADAMNNATANALLKTLEEPSADSVLLLVSDRPARLPQTVRSRCQRIELHAPPRAQALAWLQQAGVEQAEAALDAAGGNPGLAQRWLQDGSLELRREVARDLAALAQGRAAAWAISQRWAENVPEQRLWFAAQLAARDLAYRQREGRSALSQALDGEALTDWFARANRARDSLRGHLRPQLVLLELLSAWR